MISFRQFLIEVRKAPLYHGTDHRRLNSIISSDILRAYNTHGAEEWGVRKKAISLTRSFKTAYYWRHGHVVLELDQEKLKRDFSVKPIEIEYQWRRSPNYSSNAKDYIPRQSELFEKYVTKDIFPLSKYLIAIHVGQNVFDREHMKPEYAYTGIFKHPLVKIVK